MSDSRTDVLFSGFGGGETPLQEPMASHQVNFFSGKESMMVYFVVPYDIIDKPPHDWDSLPEMMEMVRSGIVSVIEEKRKVQ